MFDTSDYNARRGILVTCSVCDTSRFFEAGEYAGYALNNIDSFLYEDDLGEWAIIEVGSSWREGKIPSRHITMCPSCFEKFKRTLCDGGFDTLVDFGCSDNT